jgi:dTMP kinase
VSGSSRPGKGLLLTIEGIDGSGKTRQAALLVEWLEGEGVDVVATREPTDGTWGKKYRSWARGDFEASPEEVLGFFLRDRSEHVEEVIAPALERGAVVVCDRYTHSTLAYQAAQGIDRDELRERHAGLVLPEPDLALWIRVPVEVGLERIRGEAGERFERGGFLERVDREYARLGLREVDGTGVPEEVAERVRDVVVPVLRERGVLRGGAV